MKSQKAIVFVLALVCLCLMANSSFSQNRKRVTSKTVTIPFGVGGTFSIIGAPNGSILIEGTSRSEIEITATIQTEALSDADLDAVGVFTTFALEEGSGRLAVFTVGSHNKLGDKRIWKKIPKNLLSLPFKIDYVVRVPYYCDLSVNGGIGSLKILNIECAIRASMVNSDANVALRGGSLALTVGTGNIELSFPERNWRSGTIDTELSNGNMKVSLPFNLGADIDAVVANTGAVNSDIIDLKPRQADAPFTEREIIGKLGSGGVAVKFLVGSGNIKLLRHTKPTP